MDAWTFLKHHPVSLESPWSPLESMSRSVKNRWTFQEQLPPWNPPDRPKNPSGSPPNTRQPRTDPWRITGPSVVCFTGLINPGPGIDSYPTPGSLWRASPSSAGSGSTRCRGRAAGRAAPPHSDSRPPSAPAAAPPAASDGPEPTFWPETVPRRSRWETDRSPPPHSPSVPAAQGPFPAESSRAQPANCS